MKKGDVPRGLLEKKKTEGDTAFMIACQNGPYSNIVFSRSEMASTMVKFL